jgi:hypothetical protein
VKYALLTVGMVAAVAVAIGLILVATSSDRTLVLDLAPGECFDLDLDDDATELGTVAEVPCDEPHEAEVVAVGTLDQFVGVDRPDDDVLFAAADARCAAALTGRPRLLDRFGVLPVVADDRSWAPYEGRFVCLAVPFGGGTTTGSALD